MTSTSRPALRPFFLALALSACAPLAAADSVSDLRALVDANDAAAWEMAQRLEPEHAGDPEFDFWYGLAAKAAGQFNQALFAFERVVLAQPGNARAKLELADAYARQGNQPQARRLFEEVLATTPPEPVQQRIRTYLQGLQAAEQGTRARWSGSLTFAGGFDSNISSTTDVATHDYLLVPITLAPQSLETDAGFAELRGSLDYVKPVGQRQLRFLNLAAQRRDNEDLGSGGNFDFSTLSLTGGTLLRRGTATLRIPVTLQGLWAESASPTPAPVNDDRYVATVGLEYNRPLSARTGVTWFAQAGNMHYPSASERNAWMLLVGGGYAWTAQDSPLRVMTTLHLGTEPTEESGPVAEVNARDYAALRANLRWTLSPTQALYGGLGVQYAAYKEPIALSTWGEREDLLLDASLGWQWQAGKAWTVNADLAYADNDSQDNTLFDFDRTQAKLGATWRF